jgi:hypothetical protein
MRTDRILPKRLAVSIKEGTKHRSAFEAFNGGLEQLQPDTVVEWREWVTQWEAEQHKSGDISPFELAETGTPACSGVW